MGGGDKKCTVRSPDLKQHGRASTLKIVSAAPPTSSENEIYASCLRTITAEF